MQMPTRKVRLGQLDADFEHRPDGTILVRPQAPMPPYPDRVTERLEYWAAAAPDRIFLAQRDPAERSRWRSVTFAETLRHVCAIGAALLARGLSAERPVAILSANGIEHGLLALAAMHVGVPYTPISVPYSLVSKDFGKLRHIFALTTPGLVFADDGARFGATIAAVVPADVEVVVCESLPPGRPATYFAELLATAPDCGDAACVGPDTVAKILFTSGSTGVPKGVINTHRMLCANQAQILHSFPFLQDTPPVLVDWMPWNHTFGGNHNFNMALFNGGSLYIDEGKPMPGAVEETLRNLREISPTLYLNVPKGYEELTAALKREPALRERFFARVEILFYAAAGLAQHVWDDLERLAVETVGHRIQMLSGMGSTETAPFAILCRAECAHAGVVGLPAPGVELKLVPTGEKLEARVRGPNVTPGYWRAPEPTASAFDEEGFYLFGDAFAWVDESQPQLGFRFDGRINEDFKLATGTWVSVGPMRTKLVARLAPYLRDAVIAGIDRDDVAVLIVPDAKACAALCPDAEDWTTDPRVRAKFRDLLKDLAQDSTGSSTRIARAALLTAALDIDAGEVTDKGSLNQRAILQHRATLVEELYAHPRPPHVISIED